MKSHLEAFPLFESIDEKTLRAQGKGPVLDLVYNSTEEGKKVERTGGEKWLACFRRVEATRG
jgi:tRNA (guanine-N7-)-methyltransferase